MFYYDDQIININTEHFVFKKIPNTVKSLILVGNSFFMGFVGKTKNSNVNINTCF